jgi:hypothetical protein
MLTKSGQNVSGGTLLRPSADDDNSNLG